MHLNICHGTTATSSLPTLVLLERLDQMLTFLHYFLLGHSFAHPQVSQCCQGETSHFFPGVTVCKQNP